ncbi:MAG: DUF445 family protein [Thermoanaerobacteraceae bacterium]|nr:DUF445 family protein [Thermoanaerobacteraceae bacterium]
MKSVYRLANISLALAFTGTVASYPFRHTITGGLIQAACEAALVGGMADWFAVTALFRHPGIPLRPISRRMQIISASPRRPCF